MCEIVAEQHIVLENITLRTCNVCGVAKPLSKFRKANGNKDGLCYYCKECESKSSRERRKKNSIRETIIVPEFKRCSFCKIEKPTKKFDRCNRNNDGLQDYCKYCRTVKRRESRYGVTEEWFQATLRAQGYACAICGFIPGPDDRELDVDHDHLTGKNRGLLCGTCNRGLGYFRDDSRIIGLAKQYLLCPALEIRHRRRLAKEIKRAIIDSQKHMCKICSVELVLETADLDHDHITGMIRGYLCHGCNCGLGQFKESQGFMTNAIVYLGKYTRYGSVL
jgi:hypothetical protein